MGTFGAPRSFLSDRGTVLNGQMLTDLLKLVGVAKDLYHPQTNGLVEKYNKTLVKMLTCIQLPARRIVTYTYHLSYNTTVQATAGFPSYIGAGWQITNSATSG